MTRSVGGKIYGSLTAVLTRDCKLVGTRKHMLVLCDDRNRTMLLILLGFRFALDFQHMCFHLIITGEVYVPDQEAPYGCIQKSASDQGQR